MKGRPLVIAKLRKEMEDYKRPLARNDPIAHYKMAEIHEKLFKEADDRLDSDKALLHYTTAIDITRSAGDDNDNLCLYLAQRNKLLVERGETEKAVADIMEACSLPESEGIVASVGRDIMGDVIKTLMPEPEYEGAINAGKNLKSIVGMLVQKINRIDESKLANHSLLPHVLSAAAAIGGEAKASVSSQEVNWLPNAPGGPRLLGRKGRE